MKFDPRNPLASIKDAVSSALRAQQDMRSSVEQIRERIELLKSQREQLLNRAVAPDVAAERINAWFDREIASHLNQVQAASTPVHRLVPPTAEMFTTTGQKWDFTEQHYNRWKVDIPALLALHLKPLIIMSMNDELQSFYKTGVEFISEGERSKQLEKIDQQLLDAELAEESIIRSAAKAGIEIARRKDASSAAVEATDAQLP